MDFKNMSNQELQEAASALVDELRNRPIICAKSLIEFGHFVCTEIKKRSLPSERHPKRRYKDFITDVVKQNGYNSVKSFAEKKGISPQSFYNFKPGEFPAFLNAFDIFMG